MAPEAWDVGVLGGMLLLLLLVMRLWVVVVLVVGVACPLLGEEVKRIRSLFQTDHTSLAGQ